MTKYPSDLEIAQAAKKESIFDIANKIDIDSEGLIPFGNDKAKITYDYIDKIESNKNGNLILVTAISPTPAGEGKTKKSNDMPQRAQSRSLFWDEGWRSWWRICASNTNDRYQPSLYR